MSSRQKQGVPAAGSVPDDADGSDGIDGRVEVERTVVLGVDLDAAWALCTAPEALGAWLGSDVELVAETGRRGSIRTEDGVLRRVVVDEVRASGDRRRWTFRWWADGEDEAGATTVVVRVEGGGTGALVTVTETAPAVAACSATGPANGSANLLTWAIRVLCLELLAVCGAAVSRR
jgi:hypothetical protein